ncbi:streptogramin lyase, partial [Kitasatospora sp. GAS204B]|nr:streptogramin lyase [Kitasatospora sp. GAS204B]
MFDDVNAGAPGAVPGTPVGRRVVRRSMSVLLAACLSGAGLTMLTATPAAAAAPVPGSAPLFIADTRNSRVVEVPAGGGAQSTVPATGLISPYGVAVDAAGDVFIADNSNNRVVEVPAGGGAQTTVPATGLSGPGGVAVDAAGDVFITDAGNNRVVKVTPGGTQTTVGTGLSSPEGVAVDAAGDVYIADFGHNRVVEVPAGGGAQTTVPATGLSGPQEVAVDAAGDVFIADAGNNRVVKVPAGGGAQTTVPATGLNLPFGVAVDAAGDVFIAENGNDRVVEVTPGGAQTTVPATGLNSPAGVAMPPAPAAPSGVHASAAGAGQATVSFTPNGAADHVTGYTVTATDTTNPANGSQSAQGAGSPLTVTGLTPGDTYTFTVTATNAAGATSLASSPVTFALLNVPWAASLPSATVASAYSAPTTTAAPSGGTGPYTFTATGLPTGVTIDPTTGVLSGTPTNAGTPTTTVTVTDSANPAQTASHQFTLAVNLQTTTTALASAPDPSSSGQNVVFTATVAGPSGSTVVPTGQVTFKDGTTTLGTATLNGSGQATFSTAALAVANHQITAVYGGDANSAASTSTALTQTVTQQTTMTALASVPDPSSSGQNVTFTATVAGPSGSSIVPSGTVTFMDGSTTLGTATLNGSGQATFSTSALAVGSHSITAIYGGDTNSAASTSSVLTQTVTTQTTTTVASSSPDPSSFGQQVTFTATVAPTSDGTPTGQVTFKDGTTTLGTATLNGSGQATFATSALAVGSHSITAIYGGDTNSAASTSTPLTQTVNTQGTG